MAVFGLTEIATEGSATALPDIAMTVEAGVAFATMVRVPVTLPAAVGEKRTVKLLLWLGASVNGMDIPLRLKPLPVTEAWLMTRVVLLVLVTVTACVLLLFRFTFGNESLEGLTLSTGDSVATVPSPASETTAGVGLAVLISEILPVALPAALGVKRTLKLAE